MALPLASPKVIVTGDWAVAVEKRDRPRRRTERTRTAMFGLRMNELQAGQKVGM